MPAVHLHQGGIASVEADRPLEVTGADGEVGAGGVHGQPSLLAQGLNESARAREP